MNIVGSRITLRAIELEDLSLYHSWSNDPEICNRLGDVHFPSSKWQQERWYERIQSDQDTIRLSIELRDHKLIGYTGFWNIHWWDKRAEHAVCIGDKEYWNKGYATEAIQLCLDYGFLEMGLHRMEAGILADNEASLKTYTKCGFEVEGILKDHALRHGKRVDRVLVGILAAGKT